MPAYEFEILNEATGKPIGTFTAVLPVDQRNDVSIRRVTVPRSVAISGGVHVPTQGEEVMRAFHKEEQRLGSRFKAGEFTKDQIKRAWSTPAPTE